MFLAVATIAALMFDPYNPDWSDVIGAPKLPSLPMTQQQPAAAPPKPPVDPDQGQQAAPPQPTAAAPQAMPDELANPPALDNVPMLGPSNSNAAPSNNGGVPPVSNAGPSNSAQAPSAVRDAIVAAAKKAGIDPAYALATAQRESSFNPNSGGSGSIAGLFQMSGGMRQQYGANGDAAAQSQGFGAFTNDLRKDMTARMGRAPTWAETYMGHYFGGSRAAAMLTRMDPSTPVEDVFTPTELRLNPPIARAGTVGNLRDQTLSDMDRRMGTFRTASAPPPEDQEHRAPDWDEKVKPAPSIVPGGHGLDNETPPADQQPNPPRRGPSNDFAAFGADQGADFAAFGQGAT